MIIQTLQLNLVPKGVWPRLYVSQYDAGSRTLTFEIYNGDQRFTLTSGTTAKIQGTKPDRHGFSYDATVDTSNNVITADITQQMTAAHGEAYCELVLFKSGQRIGTLNFVMMIQQAGLNDDTDISDSDLPDIIAQATEQMLTAEAYAKGTRNGTAVTSGQTGYHDNSKYYKEQAATQANNASNSATSANTNALKAEGYAVGKQNGTTQTSGTYYHNNAQYYKEQAASSATTASTKAGEASTSATSAAGSASTATAKAQEAAASAAAAAQSAAHLTIDSTMSTTSENALQNKVVTSAIQNLSTVISKNGAKNLLPFDLAIAKAINGSGTWSGNSYTFRGITFTPVLDDDGNLLYINVDGTANDNNTNFNLCSNKNFRGLPAGSYILNGCPAGGAYNKYRIRAQLCDGKESLTVVTPDSEYGNGVLMTFESGGYLPNNNYHIYIEIWSGQSFSNAKFYPMIRLASDPDATYEPYAKTNQQLTKETIGLIDNQSVNGAVNMAPINLTTQVDGIYSYTVAADKTISAVVSSATSLAFKVISPVFTLKGGTYKLSGTPVMSGSTADLQLLYSDDSAVIATEANNQGVVFTLATDASVKLRIIWHSNVAAGTYVFKPMITVPSYIGPYVPYAKSNKELTEDRDYMYPRAEHGQSAYTGVLDIEPSDIDTNGSKTFTNMNGVWLMLFTRLVESNCAMYLICIHTNGSKAIVPIRAATNGGLTVTTSGTSLVVSTDSNTSGRIRFIKIDNANY